MDKSKYLGPWIIDENGTYKRQLLFNTISGIVNVYFYRHGDVWIGRTNLECYVIDITDSDERYFFNSNKITSELDLQNYIDDILIKHGCKLLSQKEFDKLKILL